MDLYKIFKFFAFKVDPEDIHNLTLNLASRFPSLANTYAEDTSDLGFNISGVKWRSPIGLAAGLDKNAGCLDFFSRLPFGAIEIGTITPRPQIGNDRPRLFRLEKDYSLRNKMGFNNLGQEHVMTNISKSMIKAPLGINIGKNKETPEAKALDDYITLIKNFSPLADYLVINISSPNTPGLRDLQSSSFLNDIFSSINNLVTPPIFIKLSPDMELSELKILVESIKKMPAAGIIATNTTNQHSFNGGGVSGRLLKEKARIIRNHLLTWTNEKNDCEIIGVGGVDSFEDLLDFWSHGGKAMQLYSSFIYYGPAVLKDIHKKTREHLRKLGHPDLISFFKDK